MIKKKYCITAIDRSHIDRLKKLWIYDNQKEAEDVLNFLRQNPDWISVTAFEIDSIIINGEYKR
jgi:hypothetical protein